MTLLQCPLCGRLQYVPDAEYTEHMEIAKSSPPLSMNAHPYTCGGKKCPSHTPMLPTTGIHITKINPDLIDEFDLTSGTGWTFQMYKQFGFASVDNLYQMGKEDPNWLQKFKWVEACEDEFFNAVIKKNAKQARKIGVKRLHHDIAWLSLDVGPGILLDIDGKTPYEGGIIRTSRKPLNR